MEEKKDICEKTVFVNYSNHSYLLWSDEQKEEAHRYAAQVVDVTFKSVSPNATCEEVKKQATEEAEKIMSYHPKAVMCQGEFTLCYHIVSLLKAANIPVLAACSERNVKEIQKDGVYKKEAIFKFIQFREY